MAAPGPSKLARHWMKRALGLRMMESCGSVSGSDQSLQVLSGARGVAGARGDLHFAAGLLRQVMRPQRATDPESCTGDS